MLSLMYHHANSDKYSNNVDVLREHFKYIKNNFECVLSGRRLTSKSICLVFDDAYFDFYVYVYPLLRELDLKAVLAVPTAYIMDDTILDSDIRLGLKHSEIMRDDNYLRYAPFCTWKEIREMQMSGLVEIASHGHQHKQMTLMSDAQIEEELIKSKSIIQAKTNQLPLSFIYPYGDCDDRVLSLVKKHYSYTFGIGDYFNSSWDGIGGVIYRLYADDMVKYNFFDSFRAKTKRFVRTVLRISKNKLQGRI